MKTPDPDGYLRLVTRAVPDTVTAAQRGSDSPSNSTAKTPAELRSAVASSCKSIYTLGGRGERNSRRDTQ